MARHDHELRLFAAYALVVARRQRDRARAVLVGALADELEHAVAGPPRVASLAQPLVQGTEADLFSAIRRSRASMFTTLRPIENMPGVGMNAQHVRRARSREAGALSAVGRDRDRPGPGGRRSPRGARRAPGGPLCRPAAGQRAVHERCQVQPPGTTTPGCASRWDVGDSRVRVEVGDRGRGFVADHVVMPGPEGESGRGLAFLDALASRWGVIRNGESCVWFELDISPAQDQHPHEADADRAKT